MSNPTTINQESPPPPPTTSSSAERITTPPPTTTDQAAEPAAGRSTLSQNLRDLLNSDLNDIINVNGLTNQLNNVLTGNNSESTPTNQETAETTAGGTSQESTTTEMQRAVAQQQQQTYAESPIVLDLVNQSNPSNSRPTTQTLATDRAPSPSQAQAQAPSEIDSSGNGGSWAGNGQASEDDASSTANGFFMLAVKTLQSSLPFLIILIAKIFHQHLLGFFIVLGFMTTLHWSNRTLVNQVQMKEKKRNHQLMLLIGFLMSNVLIFFYIFRESALENCLVFFATNVHHMDTWNLIWIVVCSDTIIKFITISIKATVTLLPFSTIPLRKRGNFYSAIEQLGLFYRTLTPIHPWILFLLYSPPDMKFIEKLTNESLNPNNFDPANTLHPNESLLSDGSLSLSLSPSTSSKNFPIFLCILYVIFKLNQVYNGFNDLVQAVKELMRNMSYGFPVTLSEQAENICPICQDKYRKPVSLKCQHTFCEDCVCVWLDKENSCPMCRARVTEKKPSFKDGTTTILVQWF